MKIAILDAKTLGQDMDLSVFQKFGHLSVYQTTKPEDVVDRIKDQDIVITNKVVLNQTNLHFADKIKLICITATGTNNIDLEFAKSRGIAVTNVAGYSTQSVTQHTFAMLFYLIGHMNYYDKYVKSGEYAKSDTFTCLSRPYWELKDKTWGIIGLGAIGSSVATIAATFGCNIIYYSTSGKNNNPEYKRVELDELLKNSDIISVHSPLNQQTRDLITYEELKLMKRHAVLLNLGRGGIVNEKDLARALDEDIIGGTALDVLESEPIKEDNELLKIKDSSKVFITPHIAWASIEARKRLVNEVVLNIDGFLKGEIRNRVC